MCDPEHTLPECPVARFLTVLDGALGDADRA